MDDQLQNKLKYQTISLKQFKIYMLESVDSTSKFAHRMLKENIQLPAAIISKYQSHGKGSLGKNWSSPKGNLYISIVIKENLKIHKPLPLFVGALISKWLKHSYSINTILKWPNDILLHGRKLAGVLCESSIQNLKSPSTVIIGIGININTKINDQHFANQTISLCEAVNQKLSITRVGISLLEFWEANWNNIFSGQLSEQIEDFSFIKGQLWQDQKNHQILYLHEGVGESGQLLLTKINRKKRIEINSSNNKLRWFYQRRLSSNTPLLLASISQNQIKLSAFNLYSDGTKSFSTIINFKQEYKFSNFDYIDDWVKEQSGFYFFPIYCLFEKSFFLDLPDKIKNSLNLFPFTKKTLRLMPNKNLEQLNVKDIIHLEGWLKINQSSSVIAFIFSLTFMETLKLKIVRNDGKYIETIIFKKTKKENLKQLKSTKTESNLPKKIKIIYLDSFENIERSKEYNLLVKKIKKDFPSDNIETIYPSCCLTEKNYTFLLNSKKYNLCFEGAKALVLNS